MKESVTVKIFGKEYTIPFPNVGQYYRIESTKPEISSGMYNSMLLSNTLSAQNALDMIDVEATLIVLCPELIKDLKVENFSKLGIKDYREIKNVYFKEVAPFFKEINDLLRS